MKRTLLLVAVLLLATSLAHAQIGALPYHYKITARTGTGGAGNDYVVTFEVHDANHVVKGTGAFNYSSGASVADVREGIMNSVRARAAADAGSVDGVVVALIGVDNDIDTPAAIAELTTKKGTASGYAALDAGTKVPIAQVPTGSTSTTVAIGNDSRLSDARAPTAHSLTNALHAEGALSVGAVLRATSTTAFGFGALDLADTDAVTGNLPDARLSASVSLLGSTVGGGELGNPAVGVKGGVEAKTCSGTDKLSAIGIDGIPVCAADQTAGGSVTTVAALASDFAENDTTSMVKITGLDLTVGAGTYVFEYYIRGRASDVLNSLKFAVNHTGTTTVFFYSLMWPSAGVVAATGAVDQDAPAITTGSIWAHQSTRTKNTTLGPQTGVDTANADILFRVTGLMIVTVSGTLELYHGSELAQANGTSVMAGTSLILTKTGN